MQSFTIVAPATGFDEVLRNARAFINGDVTIIGDKDHWQSIEVTSPADASPPEARIVFNSLEFTEPDDEFSRLVRSMGNYFRRTKTQHTEVQKALVKRVYETKWFVGIVAEPSISREFGHENCIFGTAEDLDAMIFDGSEMLDAFGNTILNDQGMTDQSP